MVAIVHPTFFFIRIFFSDLQQFRCFEVFLSIGTTELGKDSYFGNIYPGSLFGIGKIAAKTFNANSSRSRLLEEASIMRKLKHKNIIKFYGVFVTINDIYIIMEFMHFGSLKDFLEKNEPKLTLEDRHFITSEIAEGLQHLMSENLDHNDIHSGNVLMGKVDNRLTIKIADFDLTKYATTEKKTWKETELNKFVEMLKNIYTSPNDRKTIGKLHEEAYKSTLEVLNFISLTEKWIIEINKNENFYVEKSNICNFE